MRVMDGQWAENTTVWKPGLCLPTNTAVQANDRIGTKASHRMQGGSMGFQGFRQGTHHNWSHGLNRAAHNYMMRLAPFYLKQRATPHAQIRTVMRLPRRPIP